MVNREERMNQKYPEVIKAVAEANDADIFVAVAMVASVCNVRLGRVQKERDYKGVPADFPCEEYLADYEA